MWYLSDYASIGGKKPGHYDDDDDDSEDDYQ